MTGQERKKRAATRTQRRRRIAEIDRDTESRPTLRPPE
jgi:hypothetical protein